MTGWHYSPRNVTIVVTELLWTLASLACFLTLDITFQQGQPHLGQLTRQIGFAMLLYLAAFYYCDLFDFSALRMRREFVTAAVRAFSALALIFGAIFLSTKWLAFRSATIFVHLVLTTAFIITVEG